MSLTTKVVDLATRIGTEIKAVRNEAAAHADDTTNIHGIADTAALETQTGAQSKADAAETAAKAFATSSINALTTDDIEEGTSNLYFTNARAAAALAGAYDPAGSAAAAETAAKAYADTKVADLVDGAPALLDTLNELAAAIGDDQNFATTISTGLANRVRFDAAQTLSSEQKATAISNIGAISASDVGDVTTNFVTTFEAALV